jgi:gas vesicle protein
MSNDSLDKVSNAIKHTVDDVKDSIHEGQHRSAAEGERAKRETLGNELTPSEKVGSALNEAKHRTQAEYDAAKRNVRDKT